MMIQENVALLHAAEGPNNVSLDALRKLFAEIEVELYQSQIYSNIQSGLKNLPEELNHQMQRMLRAISREAIRLSFRRLARQRTGASGSTRSHQLRPVAPVPPPPPPLNPNPVATPTEPSSEPTPTAAIAPAPIQVVEPEVTTPVDQPIAPAKRRRRMNRVERMKQAKLDWEERLRTIGQEIRQARQEKSISLFQLHCRTHIPMHQLEALEVGRIEQLPEDIYIRGFLRQVGNALGWNGAELAASLPSLGIDPVKAVLPSWYHPISRKALMIHPIYLYVGYTALMAGGLTWLSQQNQLFPIKSATPPPSTTDQTLPSPTQSTAKRPQPTAPIASPERFP